MKWLNDYVGLPFKDGGRERPAVDCWGLSRLVYREQLKIDLPPYGEISANDLRGVARAMGVRADGDLWRPVDRPVLFDMVGMVGPTGGPVRHVGVYAGEGRVLHVEPASSAALEPLDATTI